MRKTTKIWLIIATSLVVIGCIVFGGVMTVAKWNFTKLSTVKYESNEHEVSENFSNISVKTEAAEIKFEVAADGKGKVECYEERKAKHSVAVEEDTLVIKMINDKAWYDYIGINTGTPKITVYLPETEYAELFIKASTGNIEMPKEFKFKGVDISLSTGDVDFLASVSGLMKIKVSTGKISAQNMFAGEMELFTTTGGVNISNVICEGNVNTGVTTGKVRLTGIKCKNLTSSGTTGNIVLSNVLAKEKFSIKRSTGNVNFDGSDAVEIFVETSTGDVKGTLLTDKVFITNTDTGRVNVPKTVTGGRCEISTDTGNIKIDIIP